MKSFALIVSLAFLAAVSADQAFEEAKQYIEKFGKLTDEYNQQEEKLTSKEDQREEFQEELGRFKRDLYQHQPTPFIRHERSISREDDATEINLVSFHKPEEVHRAKRATFNTTAGTWPDRIPYVFNSSYPQDLRPKVRRIMQDIMDQLCITWVEEEHFDPNNNDYETNSYLHFVGSKSHICGTVVGQGPGNVPRRIKTCTSYYTITHELLHTLGTIHEQQGPLSQTHISIAPQNVIATHLGGTYSRSKTPGVIDSEEFDSSSIMMYSRRAFTKNGLDIVIPFRMDELTLNADRRTNLANNLFELNKVYKCQEKHCTDDVDCGLGYYTLIKGECKCVCPVGFDSATNCQELDTDKSGPAEWSDAPFTLYAADKNRCPEGFTHGQVDITGYRGAMSMLLPFPKTGKTTNYHMCSRTSSATDMDSMPLGSYCVVKPQGTECNGAFEEGWFLVKSMANVTFSGDHGDWELQDNDPTLVKMKYCCRNDREVYYPLYWPRDSAFSLASKSGECQRIDGMREAKGRIVMFVNGATRDKAPQSWLAKTNLVHQFCRYTPGDYGCNEQITLDKEHRTATIKTPGFDSGQRTRNKRCLYNFKVPPGARVKVTMDVFQVDNNDLFYVRRFHKWALPQLDFAKRFKKEFISMKDFLFLEWWAGNRARNGKKGIQMTAEVLLKEESCHSTVDRGKNYIGPKSVSENFEECLPWKEAVGCNDFPFYGTQALDMMSHNYCRNPAGAMERPWCYVTVDKGVCKRSYCDVCNNLDELDQLNNCAALKSASPTFCTDTLQRMKCARTCGFNVNVPPTGGSSSCRKPPIPFDGTPTSPLDDDYQIGEIVSFTCNLRQDKEVTIDIECTSRGWPELRTACSECPLGWIPYGDRCFFYSPSYRFIDGADKFCKEKGGRMFEIRDDTDLRTLRYYKQTSSIYGANGASWVNIKLSNGQWNLYDDQDVKAPKLEWGETAIRNDPAGHGCAVMIWEEDETGNAGKFNTTDCNLARSRTFCEMPRNMTENHNCVDMSASCLTALVQDPELCERTNSYHVASEYCQRACGECAKADHETCADPHAATYTRTSQNATAYMGDVMTFACNPGLYLIEGNLKRVCGHDGQLLGPEPVCSDTPTEPIRVGVSGVLRQNDIVPIKQILLVDVDGYRVPFSGNVTQWHFYGVKTGPVSFVIYRKNEGSFKYHMLGFNQVQITNINERWTYEVPSAQQIRVQEGDVFGIWTIRGQISGTSCSHRDEAVMVLRRRNIRTMTKSMVNTDQDFSATNCFAPSLGITVQPAVHVKPGLEFTVTAVDDIIFSLQPGYWTVKYKVISIPWGGSAFGTLCWWDSCYQIIVLTSCKNLRVIDESEGDASLD